MTIGVAGVSLQALTSQQVGVLNVMATMSGAGIVVRSGSGQFLLRTLSPGTNVVIGNADGTGGDPTITAASGTARGALLGRATALSLATTADQPITIGPAITKYVVSAILITNTSTTPILAAGAIYTAANKGGSALYSAAQLYTALTSAQIALQAAVTLLTVQTAATVYMSLTVANVLACTVDAYIFGYDLS